MKREGEKRERERERERERDRGREGEGGADQINRLALAEAQVDNHCFFPPS